MDWGWWVGPLIAVVLAFRLRPAYLIVLGLAAIAGFTISFNVSQSLYPDCESCPRGQHILVWVNTILLTLVPASFLLGIAKLLWIRQLDGGSSAPDLF